MQVRGHLTGSDWCHGSAITAATALSRCEPVVWGSETAWDASLLCHSRLCGLEPVPAFYTPQCPYTETHDSDAF